MRADSYERDRLLKWAIAEGRGTATEDIQIEGLKALLRVRRRRMAEMEYVSFQSLVLDTPFYREPNGDLAQNVSTMVKVATYKAMRTLLPKGSVGLSVARFMTLDPAGVSAALLAALPTEAPVDQQTEFRKSLAAEKRSQEWALFIEANPERANDPMPQPPVAPPRYAAAPAQCATLAERLMTVNAALAAIDVTTASLTLDELMEMVTQQYAIETFLCGTPHLLNKGIVSYEPLVFDTENYFAYGMLMGSLRVEIDVLSITTNLSGIYKSPDTYAPRLPASAQP